MATTPSQSASLLPGVNTVFGGLCSRTIAKTGGTPGQIPEVSGASVLCAQERLGQEKSHSGSVSAQSPYSMRQVSYADHVTNSDPSTPGGLYLFHRSLRRLLASSDVSTLLPLPGLHPRPKGLHIRGDAVRPQCGASNLHEACQYGSPSPPFPGHISGGLPGRLASLGPVSRVVSSVNQGSHCFSSVPGVPNQFSEVPVIANTALPMVRPTLGPSGTYSVSPVVQETGHCQVSATTSVTTDYLSASAGKSSGLLAVRLHRRSSPQGQTQGCFKSLETQGDNLPEGPCTEDSPSSSPSTSAVVFGSQPLAVSTPLPSPTKSHHSHGCFSDRVGGPHTPSFSPGPVVCQVSDVSYQHSGSYGSVSFVEEIETKEKPTYSSSSGQLHDRALFEPPRLALSSDQPCGSGHSFPVSENELALKRSSPRGGQECGSRLPVQVCSSGDRMGTRQKLVLLHIDSSPRSSSRLVCDELQQQASDIHLSQSGSGGCGDRCDVPRLESLGSHLPISPNQSSSEGAEQAPHLPRDGCSGGPQMAQEQLVSPGFGTETAPCSSAGPSTYSGSTEEDCLRFILADVQPSANDFFAYALEKRKGIQPHNTRFLEEYKKASTDRQYQSNWKKWASYVRLHRPSAITPDFCVGFFKHLHDSGLAASTITSLKSSLRRAVNYGFNVDFCDDIFEKIPKACANLRPSAPVKPITWSLARVLDFASSIDNGQTTLPLLLKKTLFLITLASGARISEIEALTRDAGRVQFLDSGEVLLYPDPLFLAKNESPFDRWGPWRIPPLPEDVSLCPVACLRRYLEVTSHLTSGRLFRGETSDSVLSIKQIRAKVLYFIQSADRGSNPLGHEVRKLASSVNFLQNMCFSDLQTYTGWKSSRVFFRHYLKPIEEVRHFMVAAGSVIRPQQ